MAGAWIYILANRYRGTLYTGVTAYLSHRADAHRLGAGSTFARCYGVNRLVYIESHASMLEAIAREKAIKKWRRDWKIALIEQANPEWHDLFETLNA